jgi:hypothetical protein
MVETANLSFSKQRYILEKMKQAPEHEYPRPDSSNPPA